MSSAPVAVVAGSGLALEGLFDSRPEIVPFPQVKQLPPCSVAGHAGRFLIGTCAGKPLIVQEGRYHIYEGLPYQTVVATVDALHELGARRVIFTNAAGGLRTGLEPGLVLAVEHIALWPCRRWPHAPQEITPTFNLSDCDAAGVYVWVHGPSYEARAEIVAMQRLGYAAVGMSTAPEMARALELGMAAAAVSCITNSCAVIQKLTHEDVVAIARGASARVCEIVRAAIESNV